MAVIRQAKNYKITVNDKYQAIVNGKLDKYADKIVLKATSGDLNLSSSKKVVTNGEKIKM